MVYPRSMPLTEIARQLSEAVGALRFSAPVTHVYNPLEYAWAPHSTYLEKWGRFFPATLLVGMNPGPWGMVQTGVPFGEVTLVREWLRIEGPVGKPCAEHPKRPVLGFDCPRSEVSGARLWGWARERYGAPERFFRRFFVYNYCPLAFLEAGGRNRTPDKLPAGERAALFDPCDSALREVAALLGSRRVVGIGKFAQGRAREALRGRDVQLGTILHPSPASPAANRGWAEAAERGLRSLGAMGSEKA